MEQSRHLLNYQGEPFGNIITSISGRATLTGSDCLPVVISEVYVTACTSKSTVHHALVLVTLQLEIGLPRQQYSCTIYSLSYANDLLCTGALSWGVTSLT
jgi:hypothetical protein